MTDVTSHVTFRERLLPNAWIFAILFLFFVPTVSLVTLPISPEYAVPAGLIVFAIVALVLILASPKIELDGSRFTAGRAHIPVTYLGKMKLLTETELRHEIGPGNDARNYLLIRGWLKQGVKIENTDEGDPAPFWIITSRKPERLANALRAARDEATTS